MPAPTPEVCCTWTALLWLFIIAVLVWVFWPCNKPTMTGAEALHHARLTALATPAVSAPHQRTPRFPLRT
jgi:hypothetical protein